MEYATFISKLLKRVPSDKNHETHHKMQRNAMRYREIRLLCDVTDVNNTELALATRLRKHGVKHRARVTRCSAGNSSQSNPGSSWRTNLDGNKFDLKM